MTSTHTSSTIIKYCGPESLTTPKGRTAAENLIKVIKSRPAGKSAVCTIAPDAIEISTSSTVAGELLDGSDLNREGKSEWYVADTEPAGSNLPAVKLEDPEAGQ